MIDREAQDWLRIIGRLPDGGRVEATQAQADAALRQWLGDHLATTEEERAALPATTTPIVSASAGVETLRMVFEQPLTILFVMSGLVLLIAAANLANLMIAHTDRVQTAIRVALGAPRARLVRQALVEVTVLSLTGAAVGIVVASIELDFFQKLLSSLDIDDHGAIAIYRKDDFAIVTQWPPSQAGNDAPLQLGAIERRTTACRPHAPPGAGSQPASADTARARRRYSSTGRAGGAPRR